MWKFNKSGKHTQQLPKQSISHNHNMAGSHTHSGFVLLTEEQVFIRDCWEMTKEYKDSGKCELCHWRFKCYTVRQHEIDHTHSVTASGVTFSGAI